MFAIYGLTNDCAELCDANAFASDEQTARAIAAMYAARGLKARLCEPKGNCIATVLPVAS